MGRYDETEKVRVGDPLRDAYVASPTPGGISTSEASLTAVDEKSQINRTLTALAEERGALLQAVAEMATRLRPVSVDCAGDDTVEATATSKLLSPLAETIGAEADALRHLGFYVRNLIDRLDV